MKKRVPLFYLFKTFLNIGAVSWGGHLSLVSMARRKLVEEAHIISDDIVIESISLASVLPGPVAVNIVFYWGYKIRGAKGALISAVAVLLPAFVSLLLLSYLYFRFLHIWALGAFFMSIMPAVSAIIFSAGISMSKKQKPNVLEWCIIILSALIFYYVKGYWVSLSLIILGATLGVCFFKWNLTEINIHKANIPLSKLFIFLGVCIIFSITLFLLSTPILKSLAKQFAFISLSQVGGGYVVIPSMEKIFVGSLHWLTDKQFVDGIALSQITPGPIFIISEFIGFKIDGLLGCLFATVSVYMPSALLMITMGSFFNKVQNIGWVRAAFKGIGPVVIGMIFSSSISILAQGKFSILVLLFFGAALFLLIKTKISSALILLVTGIIGLFIFYV